MPTEKITTKRIEAIKPPAAGRLELWDATLPGFGLRITDKGRKSWMVMYRIAGKQKRLTLGHYPALSLADAREDAGKALGKVERGIDPAEEKAAAERQIETVRAVGERFITEYAKPKNRSWEEQERHFDRYINPAFGDRPIAEVTNRDVHELIKSIAKGGIGKTERKHAWTTRKKGQGSPVQANRVLATVRKFFNWTVAELILPASPAAAIAAPGVEQSRDRVLTDDEIKAVWKGAETEGYPFGKIVQTLLLTGQRREEVGGMRWSELSADLTTWTIPKERAKNKLAHEVQLSPAAVEILKGLPRKTVTVDGKEVPSDFVFTTTGATPFASYSKAKARLDKNAEIAPWGLHDLRRTMTTGLASIGIAPHIADKILNHKTGTIKGVAAVYNRHAYTEERRNALEAWANRLDRVVNGRADNVVELRAAQ